MIHLKIWTFDWRLCFPSLAARFHNIMYNILDRILLKTG